MTLQHTLVIDGASYHICLPDAETDYIQKKIATEKQPYELAMLRDMASRLQPGDLVLDVGANVGNHSLYLANVVDAVVHSFEPNRHLCKAIEQSALWNKNAITVHQVGVSSTSGTAEFSHLDETNLGAQSLAVIADKKGVISDTDIVLVALDDLDWKDTIKMIKVDVEGMELQVLTGAVDLLERDKPILYIESQTSEDFAVISSFLKNLGYLYCNTFNATPTHTFIHHERLSLLDDVSSLLLEKANIQYTHNQDMSELRAKLQSCNLKYRDANERIKQLTEQKDQASLKYRDASAQVSALKLEIEQQRLQQQESELSAHQQTAKQTLAAEKALMSLEYEKNKKEAELTEWVLQKQFADKEIALLQQAMAEIKQQLAEVKSELAEKVEMLNKANEKYRHVSGEQIPKLKEELAEQKNQRLQLQHVNELLNQQLQQMNELRLKLEQQLENSQAQLEQYKNDYNSLQLEKKTTDLELAAVNNQLQEVRQQLQETKAHLAEHSSKLQEANEKYRLVTGEQIPKLKSDISIKQHELEALKQAADVARQQHEHASHAQEQRIEQLTSQISQSTQRLTELKQQYTAEQQALALARAEQQVQAEQLAQQQAAYSNLQQERVSEVNTLQAELNQTARQLAQANEKYRTATGELIPQLKTKLDAQADRSKELQQRAEQLNQELKQARQEKAEAQRALSAMRSSGAFKAGLHIRAAKNSWRDAIKLPVRLWRLRNQHSVIAALPAPVEETPTEETSRIHTASAVINTLAEHQQHHTELQVAGLAEKANRQVRMACIMDDFTYGSYAPECELHQLTPEYWESELEACQPEVLFIESAWRGKDELWGSKVGHCSQELQGIVAWCRQRNIPTLFWNKEDPVHFETFLTTAKLFDFVFTTDMDCIHRYKAALGHEHVYFLPFACQPQVNNPIEKYVRKDAFCFAGAYYVRYPERTRDLESFVQELPAYKPLEIYDRNYGKDDPNYQFPAEYQPHIVGTLPYSEIDKAYKGYRYAINLNSVKQSQTMFARRVYELLGSNTLTISNFSRGVRLLFGDLVITSDNGAEVRRRLQALEASNSIDRLRLAGLRKAMSEHTYADRLNYVLEKITGIHRPCQLPAICVVAYVNSQPEASNIAEQVARQQGIAVSLILVCGRKYSVAKAEKTMQSHHLSGNAIAHKQLKADTLQSLVGEQQWVAGMVATDYYGPNYLYDIALATRYSQADVIGKGAYFECANNTACLQQVEQAYQQGATLFARRAIIQPHVAGRINARDWTKKLATWQYGAADQLAVDAYNYCAQTGLNVSEAVLNNVNDLAEADLQPGYNLAQLNRMAEAIQPMESELQHAPWLDGAQLAHALAGEAYQWLNGHGLADSTGEQRAISLTRNEAISTQVQGPLLEITSELPDGKHEYLYARQDVPLASLQQQLPDATDSIPLHFQIDPGLNLSLVVLYLDKNKERLSHEILLPNRNVAMTPADGTHYVRLGLRVYAGGSSNIHRLVLGHLDLEPANILGQADVLLLTNHYPSYEDLYRNGFVHSRVKAYREHNTAVDVFRLRKDQPISWHEFQNMDVITGSQQALRRMLDSGRYRHVLVHFLDPDMWDVLQEFIDTIKVTVWVHGAEIHPWYRRKFNIETPEQEAIEIEKSDKRMAFWQTVLNPMPANLHLVFVSNYFAGEVMEDIGFELPKNQYSVIHNPINTELFNYVEKPAEQRKKILSIRPFASKQYANDISVAAIQELAKYDFFNELDIRMIGDGKLFEETVAPIKDYPNVTLERRFVTHQEIAALHKEYGIFLCPTRWDSQGVSRDEAMSSGLVVATTNIAAIPEFADESCAILAPPENAIELAKGIVDIVSDSKKFSLMSLSAVNAVKKKVDKSVIVLQELDEFCS